MRQLLCHCSSRTTNCSNYMPYRKVEGRATQQETAFSCEIQHKLAVFNKIKQHFTCIYLLWAARQVRSGTETTTREAPKTSSRLMITIFDNTRCFQSHWSAGTTISCTVLSFQMNYIGLLGKICQHLMHRRKEKKEIKY